MSIFSSNIKTAGRVIRAVGALALGIGAAVAWPSSHMLGGILAGASAFLAFEALRGWCALRACGVKTKF